MKTNNEILEQIKVDRIESLRLVRDSITSNQSPVLDNIAVAMSFISKDEIATKHLKAIIKAKEMIASLMTKATLATTDEEIIAVRKSLNYYLNKVKNEIQKRNMPEELYNKYYQSMSYLREDISECLRIMKRQIKVDKLTTIINNDSLTTEELKSLKKGLNNEKRFNKRLLEKYGISDGVKRKPKKCPAKVDKTVLSTEEMLQITQKEELQIPKLDETQLYFEKMPNLSYDENSFKIDMDNFMAELKNIKDSNEEDSNNVLLSTWEADIKKDYNRYNLEEPNEYGDKFIKNIRTLFNNMPIYYRNNNRTKGMIVDYNNFYHSESLKRLIAYALYNNSIKVALSKIFRNTALGRHESEKAREHRLYMEEIYQAITAKKENTDPKLVKVL